MPKLELRPASLDLNLAEDWGADPLSGYLSAGWQNAADAFAVQRERYDALVEVDRAFRTLVDNLGDSGDPVAGVQVVRCHASFRAAAALALGGQVAESYVLMSSALTAALQGLFVADQPQRQRLWIARTDDDAAADGAEAEFAVEKMRAHLVEVDAATATIYDTLDARARERSAHPNSYGEDSPAGAKGKRSAGVDRKYFAAGHETQGVALRSLAQVGICSLSILYHAFPALCRSIGLDAQLLHLRRGH